MRKYINTFDQSRFARALNREFGRLSGAERFATALILTYFAPTNHLILCNAGHCRPLWFQAATGRWQAVDAETAGECPSLRQSKARYHFQKVANLPLGILEPTDYAQFALQLARGDLVVLYTDGIIEGEDAEGVALGEAGLLALLDEVPVGGAEQVGQRVLGALDARQAGAAWADDRSLMILEHTGTQPPRPNVGRSVRTLAKMLGLSRV